MRLHHAVSLRLIARIPRQIRKMLGNFFKGTVTKKLVHQRNHRGEGQPAFSMPGPDGQIDIAWMQQLAYVNPSKDALAAGQHDGPAGAAPRAYPVV